MCAIVDHPAGFSHEALFYAGTREFAPRNAPFVREGLEAGEPVLVMVTADKIELLRAELGADAERVTFVDMAEAGRNPGRIISAWSDFTTEHAGEGRLRGIGEPIWATRSADELVECQQHEALINLAFADADGFRLMCPYDTEALPPAVIEEAHRSHPLILDEGEQQACSGYRHDRALDQHRRPLPPPRGDALEIGFQSTTLESVRSFVWAEARDAELPRTRADDLVVAANEAATNSVLHGSGDGVVRIWRGDDALVCEVRDGGRLHDPAVGRLRPKPGTAGGQGLWIAHQVCDLVQVRSDRRGTVVRLHMQLPAAA